MATNRLVNNPPRITQGIKVWELGNPSQSPTGPSLENLSPDARSLFNLLAMYVLREEGKIEGHHIVLAETGTQLFCICLKPQQMAREK